MLCLWLSVVTQQYNINAKTATLFEKSSGKNVTGASRRASGLIQYRQGVVYGQWKIHESDFLNLKIAIPSLDEQRIIGEYFKGIDRLITLHQHKCIDTIKTINYIKYENFHWKETQNGRIRVRD